MQEIFKILPNLLNWVMCAWVVFLFMLFLLPKIRNGQKIPKFLWPLNIVLFILYNIFYFFYEIISKQEYLHAFIFLLIIFWIIYFWMLKKFKRSSFEMVKKIFLIILLIFVCICFFKSLWLEAILLLILVVFTKNRKI